MILIPLFALPLRAENSPSNGLILYQGQVVRVGSENTQPEAGKLDAADPEKLKALGNSNEARILRRVQKEVLLWNFDPKQSLKTTFERQRVVSPIINRETVGRSLGLGIDLDNETRLTLTPKEADLVTRWEHALSAIRSRAAVISPERGDLLSEEFLWWEYNNRTS